MKKARLKPTRSGKPALLVILVCLLLLGGTVPYLVAGTATPPSTYEKLKVDMARLGEDEDRAKYRHEWFKVADAFEELYKNYPEWSNRVASYYRSAEALEQVARRSYLAKDAQNAAARFEELARKHKNSVLADDALYQAALIRAELLRDREQAKALLERVRKEYPRSDSAPRAGKYIAAMQGSGPTASLAPVTAAPKAPLVKNVSLTGITPQMKDKYVRVVLSFSSKVAWSAAHSVSGSKTPPKTAVTIAFDNVQTAKQLAASVGFTKFGILAGYKIKEDGSEVTFNFSGLSRYTVKAEREPFRIVLEATDNRGVLAAGISVLPEKAPASAKKRTASEAKKNATSETKKTSTLRAGANPAPANLAAQLGLGVRTVVIDAGHGGKDPGTSHNKLVESDVTLDLAKRLGKQLEARGYKVIFTRTEDNSVNLGERPKMAVRKGGDLFISLHVNASNKTDVSGFETYFLSLNANKDAARVAAIENATGSRSLNEMNQVLADIMVGAKIRESAVLAESIQKSAISHVRRCNYEVKSNGSKGAPFQVLLTSTMPAVLIEVGYSSNAAEAKKLSQKAYRDALVQGIAKGIDDYSKNIRLALGD